MNTRTRLLIAASAAISMIPMCRAVAGIDVTAGDWKIDFSGNVKVRDFFCECNPFASVSKTVNFVSKIAKRKYR